MRKTKTTQETTTKNEKIEITKDNDGLLPAHQLFKQQVAIFYSSLLLVDQKGTDLSF